MGNTVIICSFLCFLHSAFGLLQSYNAKLKLAADILVNQSTDTRPILNQDDALELYIYWHPKFIFDFDDMSGILSLASTYAIVWSNDFIRWESSDNNFTYIIFSGEKIWLPKLTFKNNLDYASYKKAYDDITVRCTYKGKLAMRIEGLSRTICNSDMLHYPFDEHNCNVSLYSPDYGSNELYISNNSIVNFSAFEENSLWGIISTNVYYYNEESNSQMNLNLRFKRRSTFVLLNFLAPIVLLSIINIFVFLLPADSGDRISYAVTIFLSFTVYMTLVSDKLPSSNPVSYFTYYLLIQIVYSSSILLSTILGLHFYYGNVDSDIPFWIKKIHRVWRSIFNRKKSRKKSSMCKNNDNKIASVTSNTEGDVQDPNNEQIDNKMVETVQLTWQDIGKTVDKMCLMFFSTFCLVIHVVLM